jgi:hypothetical protein
METIHGINLQPLTLVKKWDTKRIKAYKDRIQKHISFLETRGIYDDIAYRGLTQEQVANQDGIIIQKFKNYKEQLKKILEIREHID